MNYLLILTIMMMANLGIAADLVVCDDYNSMKENKKHIACITTVENTSSEEEKCYMVVPHIGNECEVIPITTEEYEQELLR